MISAPFGSKYYKTNMREKVKELPPVPLLGERFHFHFWISREEKLWWKKVEILNFSRQIRSVPGTKWDDPVVEILLIPIQSEPLQSSFDVFCRHGEWKGDLSDWASLKWIIMNFIPALIQVSFSFRFFLLPPFFPSYIFLLYSAAYLHKRPWSREYANCNRAIYSHFVTLLRYFRTRICSRRRPSSTHGGGVWVCVCVEELL